MKQLLCLSCLLLFSLLSNGQTTQKDTVYSGTVKDKFVITIRKPAGFSNSKKYPAVVVAHPNGGIKEQVAGLYARSGASQRRY